MLDANLLSTFWSIAGILWGYASFAPAILAFVSALGLIPRLPPLPWLIASIIIASSCTYGGYGVGFGRGELAEKAKWEAVIAVERAARERDKLEAENALSRQALAAERRVIKMSEDFQREQDDLAAAIAELTQQGNENENSKELPALPTFQIPIIIDGKATCPPCKSANKAPTPSACVGTNVPPSILQRIR